MYKNFFGLRENPFNVNPDPRYLFLTAQTQEALDKLTYGIQTRHGLMLLTGEVGTGKTTLVNHLLDWLREQQTPTAFIFNSRLKPRHLFDFVLADFGISFDRRTDSNALMHLNQWLIERYRAGVNPVLIVDEAQGLSFDLLEEIRLLLNLETPHEKLLQIVLVGQPELEEKLKRHELRQLRQRITLRCRTAALNSEETQGYIRARLHIAGANGKPVFTPEAMNAVHFYSGGIPRVMNQLCEHSLINAYVDDIQPVTAHVVEEAAREFQFDKIRLFVPAVDSGDAEQDELAPMQSILARYPNPESPAAEPAPERHLNREITRPAIPFVVAKPIAVPDCEPTGECQGNQRSLACAGELQTFEFSAASSCVVTVSEAIQPEAGQFADSTELTSETAFQLLSQMAAKSPAIGSAARAEALEPGGEFALIAAPKQTSVAVPDKFSIHRVPTRSAGKFPVKSGQMQVLVLREWGTRWSAWLRASWLSNVASLQEVQFTTTLRQLIAAPLKQLINSGQLIYRGCTAGRVRLWSIAQPKVWPQMAAPLIQWLQQPFTFAVSGRYPGPGGASAISSGVAGKVGNNRGPAMGS
jgi:general secretion pathway protein A